MESNLKQKQKTDTLEEVLDLEPACELIVKYFVECTVKRENQQLTTDEFDSCLSCDQMLTLIESLLNAQELDLSTASIDLQTLVTLLNSSKVPDGKSAAAAKLAEPVSVRIADSKVADAQTACCSPATPHTSQLIMVNMVNSFLKQNFLAANQTAKSSDHANATSVANESIQVDSLSSSRSFLIESQSRTPKGILLKTKTTLL